jgi:pimeloyl-ACP methyl ester carboxylesterase
LGEINRSVDTAPVPELLTSSYPAMKGDAMTNVRTGLAEVNGTRLYYETRGHGPTVLLIPGAYGDAGVFAQTADRLANEFTVITYDRRGNSRSPKPAAWTVTSLAEQAADAAGLIRALGAEPAAAFGTSGGAEILLEIVLRDPGVLRGGIVHEPPMMGVLANAAELGAMFQQIVGDAIARGGVRGATELFLRMNMRDDVYESLDPAFRTRLLSNDEVFFGAELQAMAAYVADAGDLATVKLPVFAAAGSRDRPEELRYQVDAAAWVAEALGTHLFEFPGWHVPYLSHVDDFVDALRPLVRKIG